MSPQKIKLDFSKPAYNLIQFQIISEQIKPRLKYLAITINQDEFATLKHW